MTVHPLSSATSMPTMRFLEASITFSSSTRNARLFQEQALQAETKKMAEGVSTGFHVQRQQRDLVDAQSAELKAIAAYQKALANLSLDALLLKQG